MKFESWCSAVRLLVKGAFQDIVILSGGEHKDQEIADISALAICDIFLGNIYRDLIANSKIDSDITFEQFKVAIYKV